MNPAINQTSHSSSMDVLNNMFEEYQFLRSLTKGMHQRESFWCYDKERDRHRNIVIFHCHEEQQDDLKQFARVLKQVAKTNNSNLINIHDAWTIGPQLYIVQDYVDTPSILDVIQEGRFGLRSLMTISIQLIGAIEALHKDKIAHGCITPKNIFYASDFIKISPPLVDRYMQINGLQRLGGHESFLCQHDEVDDIRKDLYSIGAVMFFFSTGYSPEAIDPKLWKDYGVVDHLEPIIRKALLQTDTPYTSASELYDEMVSVRNTLYPEDKPKEGMLTKLFRFGVTRRVTEHHIKPVGFDIPTPVFKSTTKPCEFKPGEVVGERFHIQEVIEKEHFDIVYKATDKALNDREVYLHFFASGQDLNWQNRFTLITSQIAKINHPHVSQIFDAGLLDEGAYMVSQREDGEKLRFFARRHAFTYAEIVEFAHQLLDAAMASSEYDFYLHYLNIDHIHVYTHTTKGYYYRTTAVGHGHFLSLVHGDVAGRQLALNPVTLAPELYKDNPKGEITSLFVLGHIIFRLLAEYHPCEEMSLEQAYSHHTSDAFPPLSNFRDDLPSYFQRWLKQMMNPDYTQRFASLNTALTALKSCPPPS